MPSPVARQPCFMELILLYASSGASALPVDPGRAITDPCMLQRRTRMMQHEVRSHTLRQP